MWQTEYFLPRWNFSKDMNGDGLFSISDVMAMFRYVFYAPGDAVIYYCGTRPDLQEFFEITPESYFGTVSLLISIAVWLFALVGMAIIQDALERV